MELFQTKYANVKETDICFLLSKVRVFINSNSGIVGRGDIDAEKLKNMLKERYKQGTYTFIKMKPRGKLF